MKEYFIGKLNAKGEGTVRLLKEGECVFENVDEVGSNKIKCIFSNSPDLGQGEELIIAEKEPGTPAPRYEAFKYRKS